MNYEIKRFDIWSVIKVSFIIYLILGFLSGLIWISFLGMISQFAQNLGGRELPDLPIRSFGMLGTIFFAVFFSIFYSVLLTFFTAIGTLIFNLVSRITGGIQVEVDSEEEKVVPSRDSTTVPGIVNTGTTPNG